MDPKVWLWVGFLAGVVGLLALDLLVLHRRSERVSTASALRWVGFFVALALLFNAGVYFIYRNNVLGYADSFMDMMPEAAGAAPSPHAIGLAAASQFLAGWLTEYSLSVDNIFVIALVFAHFAVPAAYQRRVLFWGILGALVLRGVMIVAGAQLIHRFEWILYLFGVFLIYTAFKLAFGSGEAEDDLEGRWYVRALRRVVPLSPQFDRDRFTVRLPDGRRAATPLLLVLLIVEVTDVVFAVDSIPAIFGITQDPFLVFTSNVFAILGLRSLFFALAGLMDKFHYLKYSLAAVLGFVGLKMLLEAPVWGRLHPALADVHVSAGVSLGVIAAALAAGVVASLMHARRHTPPAPDPDPHTADAAGPPGPDPRAPPRPGADA